MMTVNSMLMMLINDHAEDGSDADNSDGSSWEFQISVDAKGGLSPPKWMNFWRSSEGKNATYFPVKRGGGQRRFGVSLEIHLFLQAEASLIVLILIATLWRQ